MDAFSGSTLLALSEHATVYKGQWLEHLEQTQGGIIPKLWSIKKPEGM
jgi:hypothetical protein